VSSSGLRKSVSDARIVEAVEASVSSFTLDNSLEENAVGLTCCE